MSDIRNTQTTMNVPQEKWDRIFGNKSGQVAKIMDIALITSEEITGITLKNQLQGNSDESTLTSEQRQEAKDRAKQTMLLKDVGDVK